MGDMLTCRPDDFSSSSSSWSNFTNTVRKQINDKFHLNSAHQLVESKFKRRQNNLIILKQNQLIAKKFSNILNNCNESNLTPKHYDIAALANKCGQAREKLNDPMARQSSTNTNSDSVHSVQNSPNLLEGAIQYSSNKRQICDNLKSVQLILDNGNTDKNTTKQVAPKKTDNLSNVDGGYAWIILVVVFIINASTFGTARAYGLIFDKLARQYDQTRTNAAMPFTIMGAIENMAGPLSGYLLVRTRSWRCTVFMGSCMLTSGHMFAALFFNSQIGQLLSMGLMCGLGLSLVTISFFQVNNAYFVRYRSTAFGLGMTGAAFGTLYISPLCQYVLDNYGTSMCYMILSLLLLPNVPLALLLKPLASGIQSTIVTPKSISEQVEEKCKQVNIDSSNSCIWFSVKQVVLNPMFHLIWPTQLLFCWLNFVFGMIIVDFAKDRGFTTQDISHLIPCWAFGQLVGRLCLSSLVDLKFLSYKSFTVICLFSIGLTTFLLNNTRLDDECTTKYDCNEQEATTKQSLLQQNHIGAPMNIIMLLLVFNLSMFIALLYILLNGLVVQYVEQSLQPISLGISSFTGSFFLFPRANIIGYYRDTTGNYDAMLTMFTHISIIAALIWFILPPACSQMKQVFCSQVKSRKERYSSTIESLRMFTQKRFLRRTSSQGKTLCRDHYSFHNQVVDLCPNFCGLYD